AETLDAEGDPEGPFDEPLWKLAEWISHYYMAPLGVVLGAMVPSAVGRHGPRSETVVYLTSRRRDWPDRLGGRQKRALDELYEAAKQGIEPLTLESLLRHSGAGRDSLRRLAERNLVRLDSRPVTLPELPSEAAGDPFELNADQQSVLAALEGKLTRGFSVTLLYGVTGSGKTEVYIRAIRQVIAAGRQAILLVPEIALATQTLTRLVARLPRVAVLHSGLSGAERAFHYQQIRDGAAVAVVGPRSAVFAPARRLGLIIVDEEHEPSYKQDTAPRYHGRDVAVMRGRLADVPVLLGSATPALESLHNARQGRYDLLRLPRRVRGLPMPRLQIVSLRREIDPRRIELIGKTLTAKMAAALDRREQIILLMNRRGYASYVFCPSCHWTLVCDHCTRAMVFHQTTQLALCHYCQHTAPLPEYCPACRGKLLLFGFGVQRIESELARKFPHARTARMDSDTMTSPRQFRKVLEEFSTGELDILLGTQMVAKGLDFPRVSLVGVVSADTSLAIPDFRASERTFQLVVHVAGRAGRSDVPGEVVVQTLHGDDPAIRLAAGHDYDGFAAGELELRRQAAMPPFVRLVRFVIRHADATKAEDSAGTLAERHKRLRAGRKVTLLGPQP
ncbi:MAG: primosomal protein N', partial [Phycisphaerae bacterium]|nr:primosomal protein N' [Phycisphaerae bacterium]